MIYLDSAATTLQKPPEVALASRYAIEHLASPGRGGHRPAMEAAAVTFACREAAARLFDVPTPEQVVFTLNATHALNLAIHTLVQPGDTVLISGYEHNAVTRPLAAIPNVTVKVARDHPAHGKNRPAVPQPWRTPYDRRVSVGGQPASVSEANRRGLHRHAGTQGAVRPPGDGASAVRRRAGGPADAGGHRQ